VLGKLPENKQGKLFRTCLEELINPKHELARLVQSINWQYFEDEFNGFYSDKPKSSEHTVRLMVGCLLLKHLYDLGDERLPEHWIRDVYLQTPTRKNYLR
jgi:IS5 family transposase